jgi:hypothetical protein
MDKVRREAIAQIENGTQSDKILEIKSVFKTGQRKVQPAWDSRVNWYAGVERLSDEEKKKRKYYVTVGETGDQARHNTKLTLKNGMTIDLTQNVDRTNWEWLKHLPYLAMSFEEAQSSKAEFYIHIAGREAQLSNSRTKIQFEALERVMKDATTNYTDRALLLGQDLEHESPEDQLKFLLDMAKRKPEEVLKVYKDKSMKLFLLFAKAKKSGVVTLTPDGVYLYGTSVLGSSTESAVAFFQQNEDLLELLEREVMPEYFNQKVEVAEEKSSTEVKDKMASVRAARKTGGNK